MKKDFRFQIISEGLKNGVSFTCRKYNISRTLYYRWLKRYKANGIDGLEDIVKDFTPSNKTDLHIEKALLKLIKEYPHYGPRAIKYLFDELGYTISESAIYNIMKRHNLNKREYRIEFAKGKTKDIVESIPSLDDINSGECWIFWVTDYGHYENLGNIYEHTLFDLKSKIACTRLYTDVSLENFENLLTAVALPVAQSLHLKINYLCFFEDNKILRQLGKTFKSKINTIISNTGFDFKVHILSNSNIELNNIKDLRETYTEGSLSFVMPFIHEKVTFSQLKRKFQGYVKDYNLNSKFIFDHGDYSPTEYHTSITTNKLILPIWAYMGRKY